MIKWTSFTRKGGIRRVVKVYGLIDPAKEARRRRQREARIRKPFANKIEVSPKF